MKIPARRPVRPIKNLGFLTEDELNAPCETVIVHVIGEYYKRGEHRGDVFEEQYEIDIVVPKVFNMGHVKLMANRYIRNPKNKMNGESVRTFHVDASVEIKPNKDSQMVFRDFISDLGLQENRLKREGHAQKLERKRIQREMEEDPNCVPRAGTVEIKSRNMEDHDYSLGGD